MAAAALTAGIAAGSAATSKIGVASAVKNDVHRVTGGGSQPVAMQVTRQSTGRRIAVLSAAGPRARVPLATEGSRGAINQYATPVASTARSKPEKARISAQRNKRLKIRMVWR